MADINYFSEEITFKVPLPRKTAAWIRQSIKSEKKQLHELNFIFCSDDYLLKINRAYLNHDYYTDIITFPTNNSSATIAGDIFISIDRVTENASAFNSSLDMELRRVMIHGVLHLLGFKDKSRQQQILMRKKEDAYLSLWKKRQVPRGTNKQAKT
ncbi:MAG TPA: rRNA maturation RNase YbeY [Chryseosolibacter sp.]|nr:rRNA maturation RNase YbeY [Chryseosolibacter sp.]